MKTHKNLVSILSALCGLILSFGVKFIFTACKHSDGSVGKCDISQNIIFVLGLAILFFSIWLIFDAKSMKYIVRDYIALLILYIATFLVPNFIVGVCKMPHMTCRKLMLPATNISCIFGIAICIAGLLLAVSDNKKLQNKKGK